MKHTASKVVVYYSTEYKIFRSVDGNRPLNKKKIDRIVNEIKSGNDVLDEHPILVTEKNNFLEVKDGQHRLKVAELLKRPVHYIIKKKDMSLYNVAKVNSNVEKWKAIDFINCYAKAGDDNYVRLGAFHKKYGIAVGPCLSLLTYGIQKHDGKIVGLYEQFEQGVFQIKTHKEAVLFAETCKNFSAHKGWNSRGFMIAMSKIIAKDECDMELLVKKFNADTTQLTYSPDWKGYARNLEDIYNKGNSKRRTIY